MHDTGKSNYSNISVAITLGVIFLAVIAVIVIGNSTFEDYVTERDQRNLQIALEDCKSLFNQGLEQDNCIKKSIKTFGTDEQKKQEISIYYNP